MLLNVVSQYELSVLSMSVMFFQKTFGRLVANGGWGEISIFVAFLEFFNFAKPVNTAVVFLGVLSKQSYSARNNVDIKRDLDWTLAVSMFDQRLVYTYHMDEC